MAGTKKDTNGDHPPTSNELVSYRLGKVEEGIKHINEKLDAQDAIKRVDLIEFRDTLIARVQEIKVDLQGQINQKADKDQMDNLYALVKWGAGVFASVIGGLVLFYLTRP